MAPSSRRGCLFAQTRRLLESGEATTGACAGKLLAEVSEGRRDLL